MSIESDFRALLAAYAPLTALIGTRVAQNAAPEGSGLPCVVFGATHAPLYSTDALLTDRATITVQAWAQTAADADGVADQVAAAVAAAPATHAARLLDRSTAYDAELGLDGVTLNFDWWA